MLETTDPGVVATTDTPGADLVALILETHHTRARELVAAINGRLDAVVAAAQPRDERMPAVREVAEALTKEMLAHMEREENALFPLIREFEQYGATEADIGSVLSPVVCMKREHGFMDEMMAELRRLTDDYTAPEWASADHRALLADLQAFEEDTREHVHKENDILFPLAMALVPEVR